MKHNQLINYLVKKELIHSTSVKVSSLSGGISSELLLIDDGSNKFVVKRALPKLKVKDDWFADVKRNQIELRYLKYVAKILPEAVPQVFFSDDQHHFFCMEMLEGGLSNWKHLLLKGKINKSFGQMAGKIMATIHNYSAADIEAKKTFDTLQNFKELRIEPYLLYTAEAHPKLESYFHAEAKRLASVQKCLVHGDFSPKNILVSKDRFVLLDCEVAWYGDPIFDLAFLLNHFILKAVHIPDKAAQLIALAQETYATYSELSNHAREERFESQLIHLLLLLMLARVDGKSPLEYLQNDQQQIVRDFVYLELANGTTSFKDFIRTWKDMISIKQ
ncbi:phosphotransferase family protein [Aestuariivivens insulae]|uniref:phosphotransferase family protein n=1 Tax=Aestuariivivens insulae TaxID=1621988 RepID=UPI001F589F16|nr:aminoglycoside phosphotransferase family protein [Aestuariivivens insulae]